MVIGSSVYDPSQSTITVPTAPLTAITNTQLLTCQSNRFRDNSSNNLTITRNGDVSVQSFSPVTLTLPYSTSQNGGSGYFDGSGDYLDVGSTSYNMAGNWTIEMWFYTSSASGMLFDARPNMTNGLYPALIISSSTSLNFYYSTADHIFTTPNLLNSWFHVAIVKNSTTITIFLNGTSVYTVSDTNTWTIANSRPRLGANGGFFGAAPLPVTGYLSNVRIVNGTAVYTSSFTPPAGPLTAITNTQLLCNFTNGAIFDNSMMNVLETISSTQISTTSPKFGTGSILFNGTTDYLTSPFGRNFTFGTGDFTIEFWVRFTGTTGRQDILWISVGASDRLGIIYNISANNITYYISPTVANAINAPFTPTAGTWYHIALTRASGSSKLFINGTQGGSTYADSRNYSTAYQLFMGRDSAAASSYFNGRVDDVRITRGIARYTANFTPSQQPFPNR
jgi:hypothetical protein